MTYFLTLSPAVCSLEWLSVPMWHSCIDLHWICTQTHVMCQTAAQASQAKEFIRMLTKIYKDRSATVFDANFSHRQNTCVLTFCWAWLILDALHFRNVRYDIVCEKNII